jgi:peroxiredoxin
MRWLGLALLFIGGAAHAQALSVSVGEPALVFTLPAVNEDIAQQSVGQSRVSLDAFVGLLPTAECDREQKGCAAVLLYFFDRERGGAGLKALNQITKRYGDRGIRVLAISQDEASLSTIAAWVQSQRLNFLVLRDNYHVLSSRYGLAQWPMLFVLDEKGRISSIGAPAPTELFQAVEDAITPFVGGK